MRGGGVCGECGVSAEYTVESRDQGTVILGGAAMPAERADIRLSMSEEDLRFLISALNTLEGGIEKEKLRGFWQVTFERLLDDHFPDDVAEEDD